MNENDKEAIIDVLHELEQGYKLGSVDRLTSAFYKEDVSLIGTAVDEVKVGIEEVRYQFQRDIEQTSFGTYLLVSLKFSYTGMSHM